MTARDVVKGVEKFGLVQKELIRAEKELRKAKEALKDAGIDIPSNKSVNGVKRKIIALLPLFGLALQVAMIVVSLQTKDKGFGNFFWITGVFLFIFLTAYSGIKMYTPAEVKNYLYWEQQVKYLRLLIIDHATPNTDE